MAGRSRYNKNLRAVLGRPIIDSFKERRVEKHGEFLLLSIYLYVIDTPEWALNNLRVLT